MVVMFGFIDVPVGISALLEKAKAHLSKDAIQNESSTSHSYGGLIFGQFMLWLFIYSVYYCSGMCSIKHQYDRLNYWQIILVLPSRLM